MSLEMTMTNTAGISSILSLWLFILSGMFGRVKTAMTRLAFLAFIICFASVSGAILFRTMEAARFPFANLYESLLLFAWGILAAYLLLNGKYKIANLGWLVSLMVSSIFLFASWLPSTQKEIVPLMPALVSNWRAIHVPPLIVSYGLLILGGIMAMVYLWEADRRKTAFSCAATTAVSIISAGGGTMHTIPSFYLQVFFWGGTAVCLIITGLCLKSELSKPVPENKQVALYDEVSQRCITIAFPLLTFGIITGALWANHAWGTYWAWDPKESMSLVTWLSYATYLHQRARLNCRDDVMSVWAVVGLLLTLLTYLGFNFLGFGGLHAYGKIS